jgi:hypothetical protein
MLAALNVEGEQRSRSDMEDTIIGSVHGSAKETQPQQFSRRLKVLLAFL